MLLQMHVDKISCNTMWKMDGVCLFKVLQNATLEPAPVKCHRIVVFSHGLQPTDDIKLMWSYSNPSVALKPEQSKAASKSQVQTH